MKFISDSDLAIPFTIGTTR